MFVRRPVLLLVLLLLSRAFTARSIPVHSVVLQVEQINYTTTFSINACNN
jgi:hypothetical protein